MLLYFFGEISFSVLEIYYVPISILELISLGVNSTKIPTITILREEISDWYVFIQLVISSRSESRVQSYP